MPIIDTDILFKLSTTDGAAGNSLPQGSVNSSLGKYISTTEIVAATKNNLFDDITGDENASSVVDYRCFFVHNNHGTITWIAPVVWISAEVSGGANVEIGLDPAGVTAKGSSSAQAATIANELSAPSGVAFSAPATKSGGIVLSDIPAGSCAAVWVKRSAANTAAVNNDGFTVRVEGDTTA